jgi:hypothetical protein
MQGTSTGSPAQNNAGAVLQEAISNEDTTNTIPFFYGGQSAPKIVRTKNRHWRWRFGI